MSIEIVLVAKLYVNVLNYTSSVLTDRVLTTRRGTPLRLGCASNWCSSKRAVSNFSCCKPYECASTYGKKQTDVSGIYYESNQKHELVSAEHHG